MGFEGEQKSWLLFAMTVSASLSFVACVFVLLSFLFLKERVGAHVARQERHLIITLQVIDLLHSGGLLLTWVNKSSTVCYIQGLIAEVACVAIFGLSSCFATHMLLLSNNTPRAKLKKYEPIYYTVLVLWTASFSLIPIIGDKIGRAGLWCWVRDCMFVFLSVHHHRHDINLTRFMWWVLHGNINDTPDFGFGCSTQVKQSSQDWVCIVSYS
jgi:hypothetical protein